MKPAKQRFLTFNQRATRLQRQLDYDTRNLENARYILARRPEYQRPGYGCVLLWAEAVIRRLGTDTERATLTPEAESCHVNTETANGVTEGKYIR
jgi:hypothetical protein